MRGVMPVLPKQPSKQGFPLRLFAAAFASSLLIAIFSGWQSWRLHAHFEEMSGKHIALTQRVSRILLLDEVLTMSARMAAATGEAAYEKRHAQFEPQLTHAINQLRAALPQPDIAGFIGETDAANLALETLEHQAFAWTHQGKRQEAMALLTGDDYLRLKQVYAGGMDKTVAVAQRLIEREFQDLHIQSLTWAGANAAGVLMLLAAWLVAARSGRRWAAERAQAKNALYKAHEELEVRVEQRTAELLHANEELQREISVRQAVEKQNLRLTQLYAALSQCNQAIARSRSEEGLLPEICRSAVQFGGMKMAWIGMVEQASQRVKPVACYGEGAAYLEGIQISIDANDPFGQGPIGTAIREKQPFWCQDFQHDPATMPWREHGMQFGWAATAALPLWRNGVVIGIFSLYANEGNAFDVAARKLLLEIALDVSYALDNFDREVERKQAEADVLRARQQLRELAAYSDNVREIERKRIALEVHDELGQQLTGLRMMLSFLLQQHDEDPEMTGQMTEMRLLVDRMVGVVRHVASNLRPAPLDLGIVPALEWLAEDFEQHSGIRCRVHMPDVTEDFNDALMLDDARATAVFRIVQESLTNVARHSGADEVTLSLELGDEYIALQVEDNGKGFDPAIANAGRSFGLLGMRERILILHGELQIDSAPGRGTIVSFNLPIDRRARTRTTGKGVQEE